MANSIRWDGEPSVIYENPRFSRQMLKHYQGMVMLPNGKASYVLGLSDGTGLVPRYFDTQSAMKEALESASRAYQQWLRSGG